jgi:hypothetical protein
LGASLPTVGEAKAEIARSQGTAEVSQELYKVAERADGVAVREDDAEPELLDDEGTLLEEGDVVAMVVKVSGSWRITTLPLIAPCLTRAFPLPLGTQSPGATVCVADIY